MENSESKPSVTVKDLSGHDEGDEVIDARGEPTGEIVKGDYDKDGNLVGWHKELK